MATMTFLSRLQPAAHITTTTTIPTTTTTTTLAPMACCPNCGSDLDTRSTFPSAQRQIDELNTQVRLLNEKATAAVDKWADYEDELVQLRTQLRLSQGDDDSREKDGLDADGPVTPPPVATTKSATSESPSPPNATTIARSYLPRFLSPRPAQSTPPPPPPPPASSAPPPPEPLSKQDNGIQPNQASAAPQTRPTSSSTSSQRPQSTDDLMAALDREQQLRLLAEGKLSDTSREVEELSVTLFEQANEMVASERRARAKLEERVEMLERRDAEKRRRLEKLESAVVRIERVRALIGPKALVDGV